MSRCCKDDNDDEYVDDGQFCPVLSNVHNHTLGWARKRVGTLCLKDINEPDTGEDPQYSKRSAGTRN